MMSIGGKVYWVRGRGDQQQQQVKAKGIVVVFCWVSTTEAQLKDFTALYSSLGWISLVCRSDYLNPFFPEKATSLAFSVLDELVKELRSGPCPVVFAAFTGGSKACMYKVFQIIEGCAEVELSQEDSRLAASCISGQIYDSDPIEFTSDLGARYALHSSILKVPGSSKLVSVFAKGVTSSLDALFLTRFGSQRAEYWQTLYSSVGLGTPFLISCSESDDAALISTLASFAQRLQGVGGDVKFVKYSANALVGTHRSTQFAAATTCLLEEAASVFSEKMKNLREQYFMDNTHDGISDLICDLQNAAVDSCQSFKRVAIGPNDHFFLPSSSIYQSSREFESLQEERKERSPQRSSPCMNANSVLGQVLFDACVPKNVEGWDIKFSGSLNRDPYGSVRKRSPVGGMKHRSRL